MSVSCVDFKNGFALANRFSDAAGFRVLRAPDVPSVLIELGYVSNHQDLQSLLSDHWRERTADSIAQAVDVYFATHLAGARAGAN